MTAIVACCRRACKARSICSESSTVGAAAVGAAAAGPSRRSSSKVVVATGAAASKEASPKKKAGISNVAAKLFRAEAARLARRSDLEASETLRAAAVPAMLLKPRKINQR